MIHQSISFSAQIEASNIEICHTLKNISLLVDIFSNLKMENVIAEGQLSHYLT